MMHRDRSAHTTWIVIIASVKLLMSIIIGSEYFSSSDWLTSPRLFDSSY